MKSLPKKSLLEEFISLVFIYEGLSEPKTRVFRGTGASHSFPSRSEKEALGDIDPFGIKEKEPDDKVGKVKISKVFTNKYENIE